MGDVSDMNQEKNKEKEKKRKDERGKRQKMSNKAITSSGSKNPGKAGSLSFPNSVVLEDGMGWDKI